MTTLLSLFRIHWRGRCELKHLLLLGNSKTTSQRPCCKEYPGYAGGPGEDQWFWTLQVGRILQTSGIQQGAYQVVREQFF